MKNAFEIQVRDYKGQSHYTTQAPQPQKTIRRKLYLKAIGNFNPAFCRYSGKAFQVHSDQGDLSDPFRRTKDHLKTLFIDLSSPCQWPASQLSRA
jgi:hypothetical protein